MKSKEIWKPIDGYEGIYEISSFGRIRSLDRYVKNAQSSYFKKGQIIKPITKPNGYLQIHLNRNGHRKPFYVHRLVANAFIPHIHGKDVVNHIDRNRANNNVTNLEWCDTSENIKHSVPYRKNRNNCKHGEFGYAIRKKQNKFEVGLDKKYIGRYETLEEAEKARDSYLAGGDKQ